MRTAEWIYQHAFRFNQSLGHASLRFGYAKKDRQFETTKKSIHTANEVGQYKSIRLEACSRMRPVDRKKEKMYRGNWNNLRVEFFFQFICAQKPFSSFHRETSWAKSANALEQKELGRMNARVNGNDRDQKNARLFVCVWTATIKLDISTALTMYALFS